MKINIFVLPAIVSSVMFASCKKGELTTPAVQQTVTTEMQNGLPASPKKINGYLYASIRNESGSSFNSFFAAFSDPERDLIMNFNHLNDNVMFFGPESTCNIDVGTVKYNGLTLNKNLSTSIVMYNNAMSIFSQSVTSKWQTTGNGSFKALDEMVTRGYPTVGTYTPGTISKSFGLTIDLNGLVSNYDSVSVSIWDGFQFTTKAVNSSANAVVFTPADLTNVYQTSNGALYIRAFNYSYRTINSKLYLFELAGKIQKSVYITN